MAVMGNVFYAAGVLTQNGTQLDVFLIRLPWLIGSVGTLIFDFTILVQYCVYGNFEIASALFSRFFSSSFPPACISRPCTMLYLTNVPGSDRTLTGACFPMTCPIHGS